MIEVDEKRVPVVVKCLQECIDSGTGGDIREVTATEFADWQKKTANLRGQVREREAYSGGPAKDTLSRKPASPPAQPPDVAPAAADLEPAESTPPAPQPQGAQPGHAINIPTRRRGAVSPE